MSDSSDISRRDFLAASCVVCGAGPYLLADERQSHLDYVGAEDAAPIERFVNTVCPMCPGGCGVRVRVVHECAVGIRGNPSHPINRGGLCARGSAVLQELYHPERLLKPQQRVGSRGAG
ncbi:MAG: twin-arginine translocation signal domain-containing protein, partial [Phycisphaerae bacterium]